MEPPQNDASETTDNQLVRCHTPADTCTLTDTNTVAAVW